MRTKTLLVTSALCAASLATAVAQTVYSVNAVGYVNVPTIPKGMYAILANPLNQPTNSIAAVLPDAPAGTKVFVFNATTGGFDNAQKVGANWLGAAGTKMLNPGTGFFVKAPDAADLNITFVGEVPQTVAGVDPTVTFPAGYSLVASVVPQAGKIETDLKLPATVGDKIFIFDITSQSYPKTYQRVANNADGTPRWLGGTGGAEPAVDVAQGFFYNAKTAGTWKRAFSVNQ
jgi:hypothetical protein